jgi:predicted acyl esterase
VVLEGGEVATLAFTAMTPSFTFPEGHRIRVEVSSSSFPKFVRNLNTGGRNEFEKEGRIARNTVHHSADHLSYIVLPVVQR